MKNEGKINQEEVFFIIYMLYKFFLELAYLYVGDVGLILGLERSPGGGHGNLLQYSCLENSHGQRSLAG